MQEIVEELSGNGRVLIGERQVATAVYVIVVTQEYIATNSFEGSGREPGLKSATGKLQVLIGAHDLELASEWTLVLSDGRRCRCVLRHASMPSGSFSFAVSGPIE